MVLTETVVNEEFIAEMNKYRQKPEGKTLLQACSENPVLFAEYMLGIPLRSWQVFTIMKMKDLIEGNCTEEEALLLTSRQIGKSLEDAVIALWVVVFNKRAKGLENWSPVGIISASDDQAKKLLNEIRKCIRLGDAFMCRTYLDSDKKPKYGKTFFTSLIDEKAPNNTDTITFKAYNRETHKEYILKDSIVGSFIKSYPPTSIILGNTYSLVIVDEAGKNDRIPEQVFLDYIGPACDAYGAPIIYTSTAWETAGTFFEKADIDDAHDNSHIARFMFSIDAIRIEAPEHYAKVMKKIKRYNDEGKLDEVQRAYYCKFTKGSKAYFSKDKVDLVFKKDMSMIETFKGKCDMGIDFGGQVTSKTVITISYYDEVKRHIYRLYHRVYEVGKDLSLLSDVAELLTRFNVQRIIPDDCPAGDFLIRTMIEKGWNVTPMNFRSDKVKKYGAFRACVNKEEVFSYIDTDLKTEMLALEFSQGSKQSVIQHSTGYTDDLIDSFVMSCYHFIQEDTKPEFYYWGEEDKEDEVNE